MYAHTHIHMNTMAHILSLFSCSVSVTHTHTCVCLSLHGSAHTQMHSLALSLTHTYTHTHSYTLNTLCRFQSQVLFLLGVLLPIHHSVAAALVLVLITYSVCIGEVFFSHSSNFSSLSFYPSFCWVYCGQPTILLQLHYDSLLLYSVSVLEVFST